MISNRVEKLIGKQNYSFVEEEQGKTEQCNSHNFYENV